jgi:gliding motility-associated-like protein
MVRKSLFSPEFTFSTYITVILFFVFSVDINAQCAGIAGNDNNTLNVCDIAAASSISIDLNVQLGAHTIGGTWKDDDKSLGLNTTTGILNAQLIKKSGIYHYTYTVTNGSGCTDSAVITVTIGAYSGIPGPDFSACNNESLNLFKLFKGIPTPSPQTNGTWNDDSNSGGLSSNFLDTSVPTPGNTYSYTYTVVSPAGSTCNPSSKSSTVRVSIFRGPESGTPTNLTLCSNEVGAYTNFDLFGQLSGEDIDGTWSDGGLGEITSPSDSSIDIQNIYNTRGAGVYTFTYTVLSNYLVCSDESSSVSITIDKQPDYTGATLVVNSDICEDAIPTATYNAVLTQGPQNSIADGSYEVTYLVIGATSPVTVIGNFNNGVFNFNIPSSNFQQAKDYTISIQNIKITNSINDCTTIKGTIEDVLHITPIPKINTATLTIAPVCQNSDVIVNFGGTSNLTDGNYDIHYNLTGSNTLTAVPYVLNIIGGVGTITIPKTLVPNTGQTTIIITDIKKTNTNCPNTSTLSQSFTINPLPVVTNLNVIIKDVCLGQPATVELSGLGSLTTIEISYSLTGTNPIGLKTLPLTVVAGNVNFDIPASDLANSGLTTFTISSITNIANGCPLSINKIANFTVNSLPDVTNMAITVRDGCPNQPLNVAITGLGVLTKAVLNYTISGANSANSQTVALDVTGGNASFLIPSSSLTATGNNTIVITDITNTVTGCSSVINLISQNFNILPIPNNPIANNQEFCKEDLATIASLFPNGAQFKWYDSPISTTPLLPSTLLATTNYYLRETNPITSCESNATTVGVLINSVATPILNSNGQDFCGADKPTIQNLSNNTSHTGTLTWYTAPTNGIALSNSVLLTEGTTYYGIDYNSITKCTSEPLEATITLLVCNVPPDGLFIPDAFSPNGDGVNDTFKIMDIEYLFPNFSLEVYNRYGNIMFKGNINKPDWDGKNSNSSFINGEAPTGVYFYIINYNKDNFKPRQGQLYLNR